MTPTRRSRLRDLITRAAAQISAERRQRIFALSSEWAEQCNGPTTPSCTFAKSHANVALHPATTRLGVRVADRGERREVNRSQVAIDWTVNRDSSMPEWHSNPSPFFAV